MANNIIKRIWNQNTLVNIEVLKGAFFQDEDGGHTFEISGVDNSGNAISLSGTVAGVFLRPDNTDVPITGSASGGIVSVTLPAECYDVPGRFGLTVFVTADSQKTCVYAAIGTVGRTSSGSVAPGTSADVVDLINQISAAVATIPASWSGLMADIAPIYSTSAAYPVGAYVYYNGDLYRCTTAITSGETWTAAHWTTAVLGNDVSDLKSAINADYDGAETFFTHGTFAIGGLNTDGTLKPAQTTRVSSANLDTITFDRDITVKVKTGFKWGYIPFTGSTPGSWVGWKTSDYTIPKNTVFVLQISKDPEGSATANINEYVSALTFSSELKEQVDSNSADIIDLVNTDKTKAPWGAIGFNVWDEQWDLNAGGTYIKSKNYIPVIPNTTYYFKAPANPSNGLEFYNANFEKISTVYSGGVFTTPATCVYILFKMTSNYGTTYNKDICINISQPDNSIDPHNGQYVPFGQLDIFSKVINNSKSKSQIINAENGYGLFSLFVQFINGGLNADGSLDAVKKMRVCCLDHITASYPFTVHVASGFEWGYIPFVSGTAGTWSGWKTADYTIPAGTEFAVQIRRVTEDASETADVTTFVNTVKFDSYAVYAYNNNIKAFTYGYNGAQLPIKSGSYDAIVTDVFAPSVASTEIESAYNLQGFGYYDGVVFQLYNSNAIALINYATKQTIAALETETLHGNAIAFLNEFYDADDDYPIAIVADGLTNKAFKVRIQNTGVTTLQNIVFPVQKCGYYVSTAVDALNEIIYTIGYTENSYSTDSGSNKMIFGKWDLSDMTNNGDNTYTPAFIESFTTPFIKTLQGPCYYNGLLYVVSSHYENTDTKIYVIDPARKEIRNVLTDFPSGIKTRESEGIFFAKINGIDYGIVKAGGSEYPYYLLQFNS